MSSPMRSKETTRFIAMTRQGRYGFGKQVPLVCVIPINGISKFTKLLFAGKAQKIISNLLIVFILFMVCGCAQDRVVYRPTTLPKILPVTPEENARVAAKKPDYEVLQSPSYEKPSARVVPAPTAPTVPETAAADIPP